MNVIFTCGGTAGHVNPALALAGYMQKKDPSVQVLFVGTPRGIERSLVEKAGYAFRAVEVSGLSACNHSSRFVLRKGSTFLRL